MKRDHKVGSLRLLMTPEPIRLCNISWQRADKNVVAVSIPAIGHGWTAGIVYHAQIAARKINAAFPNLGIVARTSPSATAQVRAFQDGSQARRGSHSASLCEVDVALQPV